MRPPIGSTTPFDTRLSQYDKERLMRTERRVAASVAASMAASSSLPVLPLSQKNAMGLAYDDPITSPGMARQR